MGDTVIHVYHEAATEIRAAIQVIAPRRRVIAWSRPSELRDNLHEVEVLFAAAPPGDVWVGATRLRLIQMMGAGVDGLLPASHLPTGVRVACARTVFAAEAAEHAIALMLALCRGLPEALSRQSRHIWKPFPSDTLAGKTLGILGLGAIGRRVARSAEALGMHVLGVCRRPRPIDHVTRVSGLAGLGDVLQASDYIVVSLPLTPETAGILDARALSLIRRGAFIVNIGRGGLVDEPELRSALCRGQIGGAAFDVFAEEPLAPESPWWSVPNTIITSHVAGHGLNYVERVIAVLLENVRRLESGEPPLHPVDRVVGY